MSLLLGKPACRKPELARFPVQFVVHVQGFHSASAGRGSANDCLVIGGPAKMFFPDLGSWVEQGDLRSGLRVIAHCPVQFGQIAGGTCQGPIGQAIGTALHFGNDVFDVIAMAADALWGVTIFTALASAFLTSAEHGQGSSASWHG
jgi:hypothetical protein